MRRPVYSLAGTAALLAGLVTMVVAGPAYADGSPIAQVTATVNPPPQPNGLLSLCITSRSLDPSGTCITIPPAPLTTGPTTVAAGQFTVSMYFSPAGTCTWGPWTFAGPISSGGKTDNTTVRGSVGAPTYACNVPPFTLSSTDGRVTGTCQGTQGAVPDNGDVNGFNLGCQVSLDNGPPSSIALNLATLQEGGNHRAGDYEFSGVYVGVPA